jgi:hypothetical protein
MIKTKRLPPLDSLPDNMRSRIEKGSQIFADASWCARYFSSPPEASAFSLRVDDLLRAGMTWCDCQWLWMAGYIAARESAAGDKRPSRRIPAPLGGDACVVLTPAGAAELRRFRRSSIFAADLAAKSRHAGCDEIVPIHFDSRRNQLFLKNLLVLQLWPNARNQHLLLQSFNDALWPKHISSPFRWQSTAVRAQTVRDAVHGLNQLQVPVRIVFRSSQKGAQIFYEIADDGDSHRDALERYGRLPLNPTRRPEAAGML